MKARIVREYFDKELKRMTKIGEVIEVTEERFKVLSGKNGYGCPFAVEVETAKKEPKVEKAVKKTTKKSK